MWAEEEQRQLQLVHDMGYAPCKASLLPCSNVEEEAAAQKEEVGEGGKGEGGEQGGSRANVASKCKVQDQSSITTRRFRLPMRVSCC